VFDEAKTPSAFRQAFSEKCVILNVIMQTGIIHTILYRTFYNWSIKTSGILRESYINRPVFLAAQSLV
jgi:hypothetical protein